MRCNYKQRKRDTDVGTKVDDGIGLGIMYVEVKAYDMYQIGAVRLRKLESALTREIEKTKSAGGKFTEARQVETEFMFDKLERDYLDIFRDYNYKYRNYPEKQLFPLLTHDGNPFRNVGSTPEDELLDYGIICGIKLAFRGLNYNLQIGAPRLAELEKAIIEDLKERRKWKLNIFYQDIISRYNSITEAHNERWKNHPEKQIKNMLETKEAYDG